MDVRNCRKCGKIFNYVAGNIICPVCREDEEKKFHEVKAFVSENKTCGIAEIIEACDVTNNQITQWIREERLVFGDDSPIGINCEICGVTIKTGRYCEKCKNDIAKGLAMPKKEEPAPETHKDRRESSRMRFLQ